jgi:hypothetical protein
VSITLGTNPSYYDPFRLFYVVINKYLPDTLRPSLPGEIVGSELVVKYLLHTMPKYCYQNEKWLERTTLLMYCLIAHVTPIRLTSSCKIWLVLKKVLS